MNGENPAENITIKPDDVISVSKADLVYVIGSVKKPGGFVLGQNESISALQVLALAEGLNTSAASERAKIMRAVPGSPSRTEIPINLKKLLAGKTADLPLQHDDILFVPNSASKSVLIRGSETALAIGTGIAIYRP
jgi:polysaccharide export outer membrane protein